MLIVNRLVWGRVGKVNVELENIRSDLSKSGTCATGYRHLVENDNTIKKIGENFI